MGKKEFFEKAPYALTFDDVSVQTMHSDVMPEEANLETRFSRNITLKIPIASAAMDTVTEHELAIELAKLGGIGIIHKNLTPEEQAAEVARVKYYLNGFIEKPITVFEDDTIGAILKRREDKKYSFHTFPVLDRNGKLVGILSQNDFDVCDNPTLAAKEVMTELEKLVTAPAGTTLDAAYELMRTSKKKVIPLISADGNLEGIYVLSDLKRIKTGSSASYNLDTNGRLIVGAAIGTNDFERLEMLIKEGLDVVVIDSAHGDSKNVINALKEIKRNYAIDVVAGNISTEKSARRLADEGADGIKTGQGPGSICTTRVVAGVGRPQLTAIYSTATAIEGTGIPVCADGGITWSGDIVKAIGAGAHTVMLGNLLAGTKEAPCEIDNIDGRQFTRYRGMGSEAAMKEYKSSRERYSAGSGELVPQGIEGYVPYKGELAKVIAQLVGGLRYGMGYVGAANIEELRQKADFDLVSPAGKAEAHPHDIVIAKDAPNYTRQR